MKQYIIKSMFVVLLCVLGYSSVRAQYGFGTNNPNPSAVVDLKSTTKGFLPPRMTAVQIAAIQSPAEGLMVYNTDQQCMMIYAKGAFTCGFTAAVLPPVASGVSIDDFNVELDIPLSASYGYSQNDYISEGTSRFQWYYATDATGAGQKALDGATGKTYTPASPVVVGAYVAVGVTPVTVNGTAGLQVLSPWREVIPNQPPYYFNVSTSLSVVDQITTATCSKGHYYDQEYDEQAPQTTYQWYRYTDIACATTPIKIEGATSSSYSFTTQDTAYYVRVGVRPYAKTGTTVGQETFSNAYRKMWVCGAKIKVDHSITDGVSAETKTVNYYTVISKASGTAKCWITQNLGADNPAVTSSDASSSASGWNWQFNRKQGYYNSGTPSAPVWPSSIKSTQNVIDDFGSWNSNIDPCKRLGSNWRLPTMQEWTSVANSYGSTEVSLLKFGNPASYYPQGVGVYSKCNYWAVDEKTRDNGYWFNSSKASAVSGGVWYVSKAYFLNIRCVLD